MGGIIMKVVTLKKLVISNWRGQSRELEFNGNAIIKGKNKSGKSTIQDAFLWLLTGYDSNNRMNFNLFDNKKEYTYNDNPVASVIGLFDIDGNEYEFKRTAQMGFVRRRGSDIYERKGTDNYSFFLDSIELSAGEYKNRVADLLCGGDLLRTIIDIKYFLSLKWEDQRIMLGNIAGQIENSDMNGDYGDLFSQLNKYTLEELKSRISTIVTPIKAQLKAYPLTIKTMEENLPDITNAEEAKKAVAEYERQIEQIDEELQGSSKMIEPYIKKREEDLANIEKLQNEIRTKKQEYDSIHNKRIYDIRRKKDQLEESNKEIERFNERNLTNKLSLETKIKRTEQAIENCNKKRNDLLQEKNSIKSLEFSAGVCNYCGQPLPEDKIEEQRKTFYDNQKKRLDEVIYRGKQNNIDKEEYIREIELCKSQLAEIPENKQKQDIKDIEEELIAAEADYVPFEATTMYEDMADKISQMRINITEIPKHDNKDLLHKKNSLMFLLKEASKVVGLIEERKKQEEKIKAIKQEQRNASEELAIQEKIESQIKAYEEEKAKIVSERVNKYFNRCNITMMSQNKSGEWIPNCVITGLDGANYQTTNGAERILIGMDISKGFSDFYQISLPVFVDDVNLINDSFYIDNITDSQLIKLLVTEDEQLIVE